MSRDRYGRPLREPFDPETIFDEIPERDYVNGDDAWIEAIKYFDQDLPFHAHEVFEQRWRCAPDDERALWKGLAQWGAARTHLARGNTIGAQRVAERALHTLLPYADVPNYIDLATVRSDCVSLTDLTGSG